MVTLTDIGILPAADQYSNAENSLVVVWLRIAYVNVLLVVVTRCVAKCNYFVCVKRANSVCQCVTILMACDFNCLPCSDWSLET